MSSDRRAWIVISILCAVPVAGLLTVKVDELSGQNRASADDSSDASRVERGRYLVHDVAHCVDCHTPRDSSGELIASQLMTGAPIPVRGPAGSPPWAFQSASLAGLVNYERDFVLHLLTKGERFDGSRPKPPMPVFHLSKEDAQAVVAYLESLGKR
ncbi:MAG: c-type cytochrome [Aureliella sp.]